MTIQQRAYRETDNADIIALARLKPTSNLHIVDLPYRLSSWSLQDPHNACIWEDAAGQMLGFAAIQQPWLTIDVLTHPDRDELVADMLAWGLVRFREIVQECSQNQTLYMHVAESDQAQISLLEQHGFKLQTWSMLHQGMPLQADVAQAPVPEGFTIRPLAGQAEVSAYVELHRTAFETKNMTVDWRERTLKQAAYVPEIDLVAVNPEGELAAFCIFWFDAELKVGQIEPLGVLPAYQNQGLAKAIITEGFRRLAALGATHMLVDCYSVGDSARATYESVGYQLLFHVPTYGLTIEPQGA